MDQEPKHYLVGRIREAIALDPRTNEMDIQVSVSGTKIFLSGTVPTEERKQRITEVVREICADYQVLNETTVQDYPEPAGSEMLS